MPSTDKLLTKWTAASLYRDGYIQSLNIDQKNGGIDQQVLRGDMLWTPTDALRIEFTYSDNEMRFTEPRIQDGIFNTAANMGQAILLKDFYEVAGLTPYQPHYFQADIRAARSASGRTRRISRWRTSSRMSKSCSTSTWLCPMSSTCSS